MTAKQIYLFKKTIKAWQKNDFISKVIMPVLILVSYEAGVDSYCLIKFLF